MRTQGAGGATALGAATDGDDDRQVAATLAGLWAAGCQPRWASVHQRRPAKLALPTYPFQRERYWFEPSRPGPLVVLDGAHRSLSPVPESHGLPEVVSPPLLRDGRPERVTTLPAGERAETIEQLVRGRVAGLIGVAPDALRPELGVVALGLDSMMVVELANQLGTALGVAVNASEVIEQPSLADLTAMLSSLVERPAGQQGVGAARPSHTADTVVATDPLAPIPRRSPGQRAKVSSAQRRLLFLEDFDPGRAVFNLPLVVRLTGPLQLDALEAAFGEIVRRHEALRTDFVSVDGSMIQQIGSRPRSRLTCEDLLDVPEDERSTRVGLSLAAELSQPFDLADGLKLRVRLLRTGDQTHLLVVTIHHVVSDGWSVTRFVHELSELYWASVRGVPPSLPELPVQYSDYVGVAAGALGIA